MTVLRPGASSTVVRGHGNSLQLEDSVSPPIAILQNDRPALLVVPFGASSLARFAETRLARDEGFAVSDTTAAHLLGVQTSAATEQRQHN